MGANLKLEALGDITRRGWNLAVECECGHVAIVEAGRMERWYRCHGWSTRIHQLRDHLYCLNCRRCPAPARIRPAAQEPTAPNRFPRTEDQWERLVRGLRR